VAVYAYGDALHALEQASAAIEHLRLTTRVDPALVELEVQLLLDRVGLIDAVGRPIQEYERVVRAAGALLERFPNEHLRAQYLMREAELYSQMAHYEDATRSSLEAHAAFLALGDLHGAARSIYLAGINKTTLSQNHQGRIYLEEALQLYRQAGASSKALSPGGQHDWLGIATGESLCLSGLGIVGNNLGEIKYALNYLTQALTLGEQAGDKPGIARACYILAIGWAYYHHADKIELYARRAYDLYKEMGLALAAYRPQLLLALVHYLRAEKATAEVKYLECLTEAQNKNDTWLEGWTAQSLGRVALDRGDYEQAEAYLDLAFERRHQTGERSNQISDLHWLGRLKLAQGDAGAALAYSKRAVDEINLLSTDFHVWEIEDVYYGHSRALAANGAGEEAAWYLQRAYGELVLFAQQIDEPEVRRSFFEYPVNAQIVQTWEAQRK
jgi:tetratricopeptide (TPR) repeat protein